jgi:hypothetical protein
MDDKTNEEIRNAQDRIWEGQHWTRVTPTGGNVWPESVVITERAGFIRGMVVTMAITPRRKLGSTFPIRSDVLVDNYELTYDPLDHRGELNCRLDDYEITLVAVRDEAYDIDRLRGMARAILSGVTKWSPRENEQAATLEEAALEDDNPAGYEGP